MQYVVLDLSSNLWKVGFSGEAAQKYLVLLHFTDTCFFSSSCSDGMRTLVPAAFAATSLRSIRASA